MGPLFAVIFVGGAMVVAMAAVLLASLIFLRLLAAVMFSVGVICAGALGCFLGLLVQLPFSVGQTLQSRAEVLTLLGIIAGCGCLAALVAGWFIRRALPDVDKKFPAKTPD